MIHKIKGGTPPSERLCDSCSRSHIFTGAKGDEHFYCLVSMSVPLPVITRVVQCNSYRNVVEEAKPSLYDMKDMAWIPSESTRTKSAGFVPARKWKKEHPDERLVPNSDTVWDD